MITSELQNVDTYISVKYVCRNISQLKHHWINNEKYITGRTKTKLKFNGLTTSPPGNTSTWYITLCSILFTALIIELQTKAVVSGLRIPAIPSLMIKVQQII